MRPQLGGDERGSATLVAVSALALVLLVGAALGVVASVVVRHRTAQSAADLAALAAARSAASGTSCAVAGAVADANGASLRTCVVSGRVVEVAVTVPGPGWLGQVGDLRGSARAGPG